MRNNCQGLRSRTNKLNAQFGLRGVTGLAEMDQLIGTGLDELNNDSARLTFPVVVGVRFRF